MEQLAMDIEHNIYLEHTYTVTIGLTSSKIAGINEESRKYICGG